MAGENRERSTTSHSLAVASPDPDNRVPPSGLNAMEKTGLPQVGRHPSDDPQRWCSALVLAAILPDLNPIEQAFAKIKHWMRLAQKRTIDDAWRHIGSRHNHRAQRMQQLLRQCGIRFRQNLKAHI